MLYLLLCKDLKKNLIPFSISKALLKIHNKSYDCAEAYSFFIFLNPLAPILL